MELAGKVAVITGGASGIGRATALAIAQRGATVAIADVNDRRMEDVQRELNALGAESVAVRCDVAKYDEVVALRGNVESRLGPADLVMNNAGVVLRGALERIEPEDWRWCFDINLMGVVHGVRAFLPHMLERGRGYIVNTGSVSGLFALTGEGAPYIASKFAVVGLTEALALYCRPRGVGVSLLCPGSVATNLAETGRSIGMTPERGAAETAVAATVQGNRELAPEEIGEAVATAVEEERFFILPDPYHLETLLRRTTDMNAFVAGRLGSTLL